MAKVLLDLTLVHFPLLSVNLNFLRRYGHVYHNLQIRLTKTLVHAFLDPHKALTQHYGAVQGISALGPSAVGPVQSSVRSKLQSNIEIFTDKFC